MKLYFNERHFQMILWHFLTKDRLLQKLEYASVNMGELLLHSPELAKDISKGRLSSYIYCLSSILSGMNFGDDSELHLLRIEIKNSARVYKFTGNPNLLDYESISRDYDLIDMTVDSTDFSNIRFRQILLLNNSVIEDWQESLSESFKEDFKSELGKIKLSSFSAQDFFMIDFEQEEIEAAINLNGHSLGFQTLSSETRESHQRKLESALARLGSLG
jgi:hypothetical protein